MENENEHDLWIGDLLHLSESAKRAIQRVSINGGLAFCFSHTIGMPKDARCPPAANTHARHKSRHAVLEQRRSGVAAGGGQTMNPKTTPCHVCGWRVAKYAPRCPACGQSDPGGNGSIRGDRVFVVAIGFVAVIYMLVQLHMIQ
jgi:hypothetical protein